MNQAVAQRFVVDFVDQVLLRDQDAVGETDLLLGFGLFVQRRHAVLGVDHRDDRVEAVVFGDVVIHEERLADGARVGHAGRFDDDAFEIQFASFALDAQLGQGAHQVAAHRAADAAVGQLDDLFVAVLDQQVVVDAFRPELVFDDRDAAAWYSVRMRLSRVVLPAPRKPVRMVTGTILSKLRGVFMAKLLA